MAEPPKDYTTDEIRDWRKSIREAPNEKAIQLLIARIEAQKDPTAFNIESTLKAVRGSVNSCRNCGICSTVSISKASARAQEVCVGVRRSPSAVT